MSDSVRASRHPNILDPAHTALVVVDLQEAFRGVIHRFADIAARTATMVQAATLLGVPILATRQYPEKLGRLLPEIVLPPGVSVVSKTAFSCCGAAPFLEQLAATQAKQILLAGIEAHVCINQTAHDLLSRGYQVHLLGDCISSRNPEDREIGLSKIYRSGALPCSVEMALFELMVDSRHEQFRAVSNLIK